MTNTVRPLRVFLCHASNDKLVVQQLYRRLISDGIDAWLDREKLLPGQDWELEITKAVQNSDAVMVCLSQHSTTKEGFIQKEIKFALDIAQEKPEGTIFIIPARLELCDVPQKIRKFHWVDLFADDGYKWLIRALQARAKSIGVAINPVAHRTQTQNVLHQAGNPLLDDVPVILEQTHSNRPLLIPVSQFRKHIAVIGMTGSGKSNALSWLVKKFWEENRIPFLAINHWQGISSLFRSTVSDIKYYQLEADADTIQDEEEVERKLTELETHLDFDKLLQSPTIFDIKMKKYNLTRHAFKLIWENLSQKLSSLYESKSLNLIIAVDEIDEFDGAFQSSDFSTHLRDYRKCGIGILFSCHRVDSVRLREVRNFVLLQNTASYYPKLQEIFGEVGNLSNLYQELEPGKGIFLAQGLTSPSMISIPEL